MSSDDRSQLHHQQLREMIAHDIKFTRTESCTPGSCICLLIAMLLISIGATSGLYYGLRGYNGRALKERVFAGRFVITRGEPYQASYETQKSDEFREASRKYRDKFNRLFNSSHYAKAYRRSEVIALEKARDGADDLEVHFNLHFSPRIRPEMNAADLYLVLATELVDARRGIFKNVSIDQGSLDIAERRDDDGTRPFYNRQRDPWEPEPRTRFPGLLEGFATEPTPPPRKCQKITLNYCSNVLNYNETGYPNILGHWNQTSLESDLFYYRQAVDAECYQLAHEFVCLIAQPECIEEDVLIYPCREYCEDFKRACANWIPEKVANAIKCKEYPKEFDEDEIRGHQRNGVYNHDHLEKDCPDPSHKLHPKRKCKRKPTLDAIRFY